MKDLTIRKIIKLKFNEFEKYVFNQRTKFLQDLDEGNFYIVESGLNSTEIENLEIMFLNLGKILKKVGTIFLLAYQISIKLMMKVNSLRSKKKLIAITSLNGMMIS